jgi:hypothetical protein
LVSPDGCRHWYHYDWNRVFTLRRTDTTSTPS